jgi:hypothetical protein
LTNSPSKTPVKTVATHQVVQAAHPREVTEKDEVGMAIGKAIDGTLSQYSHEASQGHRPTATSMNRVARGILDEELRDAHLELAAGDLERVLVELAGVLSAFRRSELFGLPRPRTRMILINGRVGVYAQPDYWDGRRRIYEMKSYRAFPVTPDVGMQLGYFQLAYPGFVEILACFDRHSSPVEATLHEIPPLDANRSQELLRLAYHTGLTLGTEKVLEFIDLTIVHYSVPL